MRRMRLPETQLRPVECAKASSKVMPHCIQKGHLRAYEEMRPQLREGRDDERPSRSLGRPSASDRHDAAAKSNQHSSKSPTSCRSHHSHQGRPSSACSGRNSGSGQRCDHLYRPSAACIALSKDLPTAARSAAEAMHMHARAPAEPSSLDPRPASTMESIPKRLVVAPAPHKALPPAPTAIPRS